MYTPPEYQWSDKDEIAAFLRAYPFGVLISSMGGILGTHLPFVLHTPAGGWQLTGHMAAANPQSVLPEGSEVMAIFSGPHAYISPQHYSAQHRVPTWNYLAVHLYGNISLTASGVDRNAILEDLILQSEPAYSAEWQKTNESYKQRLYPSVTPFNIAIHRMEATKKLSQDKPVADRTRIIDTLRNGTTEEQALALYMQSEEDKAP